MKLTSLAVSLLAASSMLVVANQGGGSISFVDRDSLQVLETIEAGVGPHEAAASPDGSRVAITLYGRQTASREVLLVDPKTRSIVKRIDLAPSERPHGVTWRRGGIYVTLEKEGSVARIDPSTGAIAWRAKTGGEVGHMLAVTRDEKKLYTGNLKTNDISAIRIGEASAYKTIKVGAGPEGIALSPDDRELWAAHRMAGGISIIDTAKDEVIATIAPEIFSARVTMTPDGKKVLLFDMASKSVVLFDRATRKEIGRVATAEGVPVGGSVTPDSSRAYVLRYQPDAIVELDLKTLKFGREVQTAQAPDGLAILGK
ncbi:MAG TPA: YncE family protein [Thermoanaerobaculia bacterium]|jgi:YVTN family beta-propeller protein